MITSSTTTSTTSTPTKGPRSIAAAAADVPRPRQDENGSELATSEPSFLLCGCDSCRACDEQQPAEAAYAGGHGLERLATRVVQALKKMATRVRQ